MEPENASLPKASAAEGDQAPGMPSFETGKHLARLVLFSFILTFVLTRLLVFLIMSRTIPDLYFYLGGSHIHHLNYGIFLLAGAGAYLLFRQPTGPRLFITGVIYGIGLGLTFDEFGMWLHLGGSYWQRASWDAITVVAALLGMIAFAPPIRRFRSAHWWVLVIMVLMAIISFFIFAESFKYAGKRFGPRIQQIERSAPQ